MLPPEDTDRSVVMEAGRIRAEGTHRELLDSDALYRSLVDAKRLDDRAPGDPAHAPAWSRWLKIVLTH